MNLQEKATAALSWFSRGERESTETGQRIWVIPHDGTGWEWVRDLVRDAHDDHDGQGPMLPDDFRYQFIVEALDYLAEGNDSDEYAPEPDVYNASLLRWLGSHGWRAGYCDEATDEFGEATNTMQRIGLGQVWEMRLVFDTVRAYLEALEDETCTAKPEESNATTL